MPNGLLSAAWISVDILYHFGLVNVSIYHIIPFLFQYIYVNLTHIHYGLTLGKSAYLL